MKLHHLRPAPGATGRKRRVGRGRAAGQGKTAGRGTKGLLAKHNPKLGFEGGQMPMQRRIPHLKGFTNPNRVAISKCRLSSKRRTGMTLVIFSSGLSDKTLAMARPALVRLICGMS